MTMEELLPLLTTINEAVRTTRQWCYPNLREVSLADVPASSKRRTAYRLSVNILPEWQLPRIIQELSGRELTVLNAVEQTRHGGELWLILDTGWRLMIDTFGIVIAWRAMTLRIVPANCLAANDAGRAGELPC